jgi:hypothetical protein
MVSFLENKVVLVLFIEKAVTVKQSENKQESGYF